MNINDLGIREDLEYFSNKYTPKEACTVRTKHAHLIDLPKAFDPNERPVMCSECKTVTSLYHGFTPKYCSNCGAMFDKEENEETVIENIDGYVSKDSFYRLLSNYRRTHVLTEKESSIVDDIIVAIKDMPNEMEEE